MTVDYHESPCIINNVEDEFMEAAYEVFKEVKSTDFYFHMASEELLNIRNKIHERVSSVLDIYNKKYPVTYNVNILFNKLI